MLKHIHFGAGAFGLGFVCWLTNLAGYQTTLFNRPEKRSGTGNVEKIERAGNCYFIVSGDDSLEPQRITLKSAFPVDAENDRDRWLAEIDDEGLSLITTSVKDIRALESYYRIIMEAAQRRHSSGTNRPIYFMACENGFTSYDARDWLKARCPEQHDVIDRVMVFVPCVVDRICLPSEENEENVVVQTEKFAKLFVPETVDRSDTIKRIQLIETLLNPNLSSDVTDIQKQRLSRVVTFVNDIERYRRLKKLVVNGGHLIIALSAHRHNETHIDEFCAKNTHWCEVVLQEMAAIASYDPVSRKIDEPFFLHCSQFAKETQARFLGRKDLVSRVLSRFSDPFFDTIDGIFVESETKPITFVDTTSSFFRSYLEKVASPAQEFAEGTGAVPVRCFDASVDVAVLLSEARYPSLSLIRGAAFYQELVELIRRHGFELRSFVRPEDEASA